MAAVEILEVQVDPNDPPEYLLVYGTGFGDISPADGKPVIYLGTQMTALVIAADQSACSAAPPPPLDGTGVQCVVAELPEPVPCGDYQLALEGDLPLAGCENGKPAQLMFEYTGGTCAASTNPQEGKFQCTDSNTSAPPVQILCDKCTVDPSDASVELNSTVVLTAPGGKFGADTTLQIVDANNLVLQDLKIHTSCSKQLVVGDVFGSLTLVGFVPEGSSLQDLTLATYDLTMCPAVEGPQGPQGKLGPQGEQGPQGKLGDTGAQGPQGKLGDTGAQGPQGKLGETGAQGPQGKLGDTGAQGPQGKLGDTGAQGPQGKLGDTGAQGPQGKQGEKGDPGADGIGENLLCFSTDQTIGNQGKYMGLGQQAGEHDTVSVISPFGGQAQVLRLVVKVAQGNQPSDGNAVLFHDNLDNNDPNQDEGLPLSPDCVLVATPSKSICEVNFIGDLNDSPIDSLSVFVETDSGSFEAASACILIDPDGGN